MTQRLHLDFARYNAPYDLHRDDREWENILGWVKLALEREQMRPKPATAPAATSMTTSTSASARTRTTVVRSTCPPTSRNAIAGTWLGR